MNLPFYVHASRIPNWFIQRVAIGRQLFYRFPSDEASGNVITVVDRKHTYIGTAELSYPENLSRRNSMILKRIIGRRIRSAIHQNLPLFTVDKNAFRNKIERTLMDLHMQGNIRNYTVTVNADGVTAHISYLNSMNADVVQCTIKTDRLPST